jgi:hypothetical protein
LSVQPERTEGVILLLQQRGDYTPAPETADGKRLRLSTRRGESPSRRQACEDCDGTGRKRGNLCWRCLGDGAYDVDDYTGQKVISSHSETPWETIFAAQKPARCSACAGTSPRCSRCNGTKLEPGPQLLGGKADLTGGVATRARQRSERTGDPGLDTLRRHHLMLEHPAQQALTEALSQIAPPTRMLVEMVYVDGLESRETLLAKTGELVDRTVGVIAELMPAEFVSPRAPRLELPSEVWAAWRHRTHKETLDPRLARATAFAKGRFGNPGDKRTRDAEIRRLHGEGGHSLRALGRKFNLTHVAVKAILAKEAA